MADITVVTVEVPQRITSTQVNVGPRGAKGEPGSAVDSVDTDDPLLSVSYDEETKAVTLATNIYTGTGDAPDGMPEGSIYLKYT